MISVFAPDEVHADETELQVHAEKFIMIPDGVLGSASDVSQQEREKMLGFVYDISDPKQGMIQPLSLPLCIFFSCISSYCEAFTPPWEKVLLCIGYAVDVSR